MTWFTNLKTMTKLMAGFALLSLVTAGVGYMGINGMTTINRMLNTMYERDMNGLSNVKEANIALLGVGRAARQAILESDAQKVQAQRELVETRFKEITEHVAKTKSTIATERGHELIAIIEDALPQYQPEVRKAMELAAADKDAEAVQTVLDAKILADKLDGAFNELAEAKEKLGQDAYHESDVVFARARATMLALITVSVLGGLGLGFFIARVISRPLAQAVDVLKLVGEGDYTKHLDVSSKDEVGQLATALNKAIDEIREALREVRDVSESVASASQQLSSGAQEISSGAQEQASSIEETAASLEEMTATVKANADNAQQASQFAVGSRDVAEKGGHVVMQAVDAMGEINTASKKIADIITTIDEIAFQTNLLALNAAVEAARAGEQGRGFAVVAAEVRNLAQRSATAAKEIKGLIQDSVRKVEGGAELVNRSGQTLQEIVTSVKRVTDIVAEIAAASKEQTSGIGQVNKAMTQMDQVTQANASQTEELSSTAESLSAQAEQLSALVSRFKLEDGKTVAARQRPAASTPRIVARNAKAKSAARATESAEATPRSVGLKTGTTGTTEGAFEEF